MIGKGAYGCIFSPPLLCRGQTKPKSGWKSSKLGKLTEVRDIKNEILAAKILGPIPSSNKYFLLPEVDTLCRPAEIEDQKEGALKDCEPLEKYGIQNMAQYEVEYGGKTLKNRLLGADVSVSNFPFFDFMRNLLETGAVLVLHGYIHNDLHANNILVNTKFHPRLIDFGRSYLYSAINQELVDELSAYYNPELGQLTPECSAQHGVDEGIPFERILSDLSTLKPGLKYGERILGISRKEQVAEFKQFWESSLSVQKGDWPTFYKLYWPVVDSWAIGHNLLSILRKLMLSKQFVESAEWKQKQGVVKEVVRGLLRASPRKRLDAVEALALYDPMNDVVSGASGKAWLEKKEPHE